MDVASCTSNIVHIPRDLGLNEYSKCKRTNIFSEERIIKYSII